MGEQKQWFYVQGSFFNRFSSRQEEGLLGPFPNEESAVECGYEKNMTQIEVLSYPTSNLAAATKMWKATKITKHNQDWDEAVQKVRHKGADIGVEEEDVMSESYSPNLME